eukprot:Sro3458_g348220.1 n/a (460) ;mRNA; r:3041-4420
MTRDYYQAHQDFVGERYLGKYDHPTGIPLGWQGQTYGLPIHSIIQWQWDFLVCCGLLLLSIPTCLVGSILIFAIKFIPGTMSWWRTQCEHMSREETAECLGCWAFYVAGLVLTPVAALVASAFGVLGGSLLSIRVTSVYLRYGYLAGIYEPFHVIHDVDSWDFFSLGGFLAFACLGEDNPHKNGDNRQQRKQRGRANSRSARKAAKGESRMLSNAYWDRFANQCIQTTFQLIEKEWVTRDQVQSMDSAVIQAIPAVAVLTVLVDTVHDAKAKKPEDLSWKIDGTLCKQSDRPPLDGIAALLLPKVMEVKRLLQTKKSTAKEANVQNITAMICSNADEPTQELEAFIKSLENDKSKPSASNNMIRAKLTELTLMMLQVQPFLDRMNLIFGYNYAAPARPARDLEEGDPGAEADISGTQNQPAHRKKEQTDGSEEAHGESWMTRAQWLFGQRVPAQVSTNS